MSRFLEKVHQIKKDERQYEAYQSETNTVVIAGPGSGKTTILTLKILQLLYKKIYPPRGLACITYSKEAVREFTERLIEFGFQSRQNVFLGTVHSFCIAEIIIPFGHLYPELNIPSNLTFISDSEKNKLISKILFNMQLAEDIVTPIQVDKERINNVQGKSKINIPNYDIALKVATEYEKQIRVNELVDFISIVKYATLLIQEKEYVRSCLEARFPWILIDEYQDLGKPLHEMILSLFSATKIKIFAVGDPDQSIYSFQGGNPEFLNELRANENFKAIRLTKNYRSNQDIINASEIGLNPKTKRNYIAGIRINENAEFNFIVCNEGMNEQYDVVVEKIIPNCLNKGIPLREIAVIVWSNKELQDLSAKFVDNNIPFFIAKHSFERSDIVKWIEKCAYWCCYPNELTFSELFEFWKKVKQQQTNQIVLNDILEKIRFYKVMALCKSHMNDSLNNWLYFFINELKLLELMKNSRMFPDEYLNLQKLLEVTKRNTYSNYSLDKFARLGKPQEEVTLTTRHSSKGLEFEVVIMLGLEEGRFPYYKIIQEGKQVELEENHRIFFVCISRAKSICYLIRSNYHTIPTKHRPWKKQYEPSRFWDLVYAEYGSEYNTFTSIGFK